MGNLNIDETQKAHSKIIKKFPNRNPHATGVLVKVRAILRL